MNVIIQHIFVPYIMKNLKIGGDHCGKLMKIVYHVGNVEYPNSK